MDLSEVEQCNCGVTVQCLCDLGVISQQTVCSRCEVRPDLTTTTYRILYGLVWTCFTLDEFVKIACISGYAYGHVPAFFRGMISVSVCRLHVLIHTSASNNARKALF